jgi:hypothetical protein
MSLAQLDIDPRYGDFRIFAGFLPREEVSPDRPYSKRSKSCADTAENYVKEFASLWWRNMRCHANSLKSVDGMNPERT